MKATLDINLEKQENSDDENTQTGRLKFSVADKDSNQIISGASVDVNAKDSEFTGLKEKVSARFATFESFSTVNFAVSGF